MRIHQCLAAGKKWSGNASVLVHGIEAENTAKIGQKENSVPDNPRGKQ
jgi:hypothetical protein